MTIIIDTNVIISALISKGVVRELVVYNPGEFITPDWCFQEVLEHQSAWNRNGRGVKEVGSIIQDLKDHFIIPIPKTEYQKKMRTASSLIDDPDDVPILALALSLDNAGIWTFDIKHFNTMRIAEKSRILTTDDVRRIIMNKRDL